MRMRRYLAVILILLFANLAAASFAPGDIEWASGVSGTLSKGGTVANGEYTVKAIQFPSPVPGVKDINGNIVPETDVDPSVLVDIYKNSTLLAEQVLAPGIDTYIDPDYEVKVTATGFPAGNAQLWVYEYYAPWATISIQKRGLPKLDVTVTTDKSSYTSYEDTVITATVTITNSGAARAENVDVFLNTGGLQVQGGATSQLHQHYSDIEAGKSQSFSVTFVVPLLLDPQSYSLSANATCVDVKSLEYSGTGTDSITVGPKAMDTQVTISKGMRDRIYLQDMAYVSISVGNSGIYEIKNISVNDSMNGNFDLKSNTSLRWFIPDLKPGQEWDTTYSMQPLSASLSGFAIPAANATFSFNNRPYTIYSKTTTLVVNGPKIIINKTVNKPVVNISENVTVNVTINNIGDIVTNAEVNDSLPDGINLVNSTINFLNGNASLASTSLELNTPVIFNYTIRIDKEGKYKLPPATASYTDIAFRGTSHLLLSSESPVITVIDPKATPIPTGNPAATVTAGSQTAQDLAGSQPKDNEESFLQKIIDAIKNLFPQPENSTHSGTLEPTPTPVTPGFDIVFAIIVLIIAALYRHK